MSPWFFFAKLLTFRRNRIISSSYLSYRPAVAAMSFWVLMASFSLHLADVCARGC